MSLFLDTKYANLVSPRLERFKRKNSHLFNFRCNLCGDSEKRKDLARGFLYAKEQQLFYRCHNCGAGMSFGNWLATVDQSIHGEYIRERFQEKNELGWNYVASAPTEEPKKEPVSGVINQLPTDIFTPILEVSEVHRARRYLRDRKIPLDRLHDIYLVEGLKRVSEWIPTVKFVGDDSRIAFPFRDYAGNITGVTFRDISGKSATKYLTSVFDSEKPQVFGLEQAQRDQRLYVVEGPIDSLFLSNSVAVSGTALSKFNDSAFKDVVYVFDNQPRNREVTSLIERLINRRYTVCIWPDYIQEKDINEMILAGRTATQVQEIVDQNSVSGLEALCRFVNWKKC